jgi:hypothetical protein
MLNLLLSLVYARQRLKYVPHHDCEQKQVCLDIVELLIVDPKGMYYHGYIGAEDKKDVTNLEQEFMSQKKHNL